MDIIYQIKRGMNISPSPAHPLSIELESIGADDLLMEVHRRSEQING
jgi:hypothetical protein